ncbi:related to cytochrome b-type NAD(P)H oxidoreductase [Cephalotrichum gorgonifer]|uniref:Related to cytochrome b-type NAD(P)H oxidoreductase n=1 Tax=Cephalotrichum gorgonifer TaxID=2041049 RepID=A0AAE8SV70_9PEZI|nr:related to cytochrome b-type NAD(P)H oxidoreductase [Cephalotrichum gorgonifer]
MAVIGISLIVASVLWVLVRPPPWLAHFLLGFRAPRSAIDKPKPARGDDKHTDGDGEAIGAAAPARSDGAQGQEDVPAIHLSTPDIRADDKAANDRALMPPPPLVRPPTTSQKVDAEPTNDVAARDRSLMPPPPLARTPSTEKKDDAEQTTPKARPSQPPRPPVPDFALPPPSAPTLLPPVPSFPAANSPQRAGNSGLSPTPNRLPSLFPPTGPRPSPLPDRGRPSGSSSSLAPPPTHSVKPAKPSRKVILSPGHSPLDWASISGPTSDLRNLPPSTPYLRVTPSMLKRQHGRKGTDAWMVLGGRVYNVSPYADYHPGGVPELMRGAGKDGTKLFGEVHPWVNYEGMLQACLVGVYVEEGEKNKMEEMD